MLTFGNEGADWLAETAGRPVEELGVATLSKKKNGLKSPKGLAALSVLKDPSMLQLSEDVRIAFREEAMTIDAGGDEDDDYGF